MTCDEIIKSNDFYDVIVSREAIDRVVEQPDCEQPIDENYTIYYTDRQRIQPLSVETYTYSAIPKCLGLLDTTALEKSGILQLQTQPALSLKGQGVLVGFVDTGIAYENACFRNSDGSTRIKAIWDQTASPQSEEELPQGFIYGKEYTQETINRALQSGNTKEIVQETDENGHGTVLASIACGSEDPAANFTGAAPYSDILVVKLKPAKQYLKDFFYIPSDVQVYQENDVMAGVAYLEKKAEEYGQPLVICIGLGMNNGSHSGAGVLSEYLNSIGGRWRRCVVIASGNEANARHHFMERNPVGSKGDGVSAEINVEESIPGFYLELWTRAPELFAVSVRSPGGSVLPPVASRSMGHQAFTFTFENTRVELDYRTVGRTRGDQLVFIRFERPTRGIWTLNVYPDTSITAESFNVWLPMSGMLFHDVYFLKPDPDITLTVPSAANIPITVGGYRMSDNSIYLNSGRGYTVASVVKPDFTAPAVAVQGVGKRGNYTTMDGTSAAAAITAGACAQIMEWGVVRRMDVSLNSVEIGNILIRGCNRDSERVYPNTSWGYGRLDMVGAFETLIGV